MSISTLHEALLWLFRDQKRLAVDLLQDTLHVPLPRFRQIHLEPNEVGNLKPTKHRADLIFTLRNSRKKPVRGIILEVQLHISPAKRESWPIYLVNLRGRLHCEVILLVVAVSASVAHWASQPIEMGHPGWVLRPLVVGPEMIPIITQFERARHAPELAVLSAMAHGRGEHGEAIATAALGALEVLSEVDAERATLYHELIDQHLNTAAKRALEDLMELKWQYRSNFAKKYIGIGRAEGELEGEARGRAEGVAKGKAEGVLAVLEARGLRVPKRIRVAVLGCTDLEQLDAWLRRAVSVEKASELLG